MTTIPPQVVFTLAWESEVRREKRSERQRERWNLVFCLGTVIHSGLSILSNMENRSCTRWTALIDDLSRLLFSFLQFFFIFKHSNVSRKSRSFAFSSSLSFAVDHSRSRESRSPSCHSYRRDQSLCLVSVESRRNFCMSVSLRFRMVVIETTSQIVEVEETEFGHSKNASRIETGKKKSSSEISRSQSFVQMVQRFIFFIVYFSFILIVRIPRVMEFP